jgi:cation diffusion facilitator family transporter
MQNADCVVSSVQFFTITVYSMSHSNSTKAIIYAFAANLGIAITKTGAAIWTGSGSMMAEAVHSFADCGNQVLLFVGMKRSAKVADQHHPMGYGRESYIWSMMVAITLFSVGGLFSIYEGWERYNHLHSVENAEIALAVLVVAVFMEALSLKGALGAMKPEQAGRSLWQWFRETHSSELMVVIGEDLAALLGLMIAAAMLGLTLLTGNAMYDALGSILIGVLLIAVALMVGHEVHNLLLGEADSEVRDAVAKYLQEQTGVVRVLNTWAINHGNDVMLAVKVELSPDLLISQAVPMINAMECEIKSNHPRVKWIFFELDDRD